MKVLQSLKAQAGKIKENLNELYTMTLITVGIPVVVYLFADWRWSLAVFVFTQIAIGLLRLKYEVSK